MVVVLPVPLTPTTSRTAGPPSADGPRRPVEVARDEQGRELGADRRLGATRVATLAGPLDEIDGERRADVAGDERLLDVVPLRVVAAEEAAQLGHEAGPRPLEALVEGVRPGRRRGRRSDRTARRRARGPVGRPGSGAAPARARVRLGLGLGLRLRLGLGRRARPQARAPARAPDLGLGLRQVEVGRIGLPAGAATSSGSSSRGRSGVGVSAGRGSSRRRRQNGISQPTPRSRPRSRRQRLRLVEPQADDPRHRVVADGHAVQRVGGLDRAAVVGDDDELRLVRQAPERVREPADVRLVERRIDLVEHAERDRPDLEHREQQRDGGQGALAAGQHRERLRLLAGRPGDDLDARSSPRSCGSVSDSRA